MNIPDHITFDTKNDSSIGIPPRTAIQIFPQIIHM